MAKLGRLIAGVLGALSSFDGGRAAPAEPEQERAPAAQLRKSVGNGGIVSFIDGKTYQSLKRHLGGYGLDGAACCERYGLPADYPMPSPAYSAKRSEFAKILGRGQQRRKAAAPEQTADVAPKPGAAEPKRRGRRKAIVAITDEEREIAARPGIEAVRRLSMR